tara:strand:- start:542 stop:727 length:186 start_codon:yes stop_codon:yes gene_type:complete
MAFTPNKDTGGVEMKDQPKVVHGKYYPECVDCTRHHGFDIVFTMSCFISGHERLWIADEEE